MATAASQVIARELEAGEVLLWSGQPRKGVVLRGSDAFMIPFSLMWGGFAIFWEMSVLALAHKHGGNVPFFFVLWGIPFVLIGLYLIFGRFLVDASQRDNTYYGVTDHRVIIVTGLFDRSLSFSVATLIAIVAGLSRRKVKSLDLRTLTDISMTERSDGSGTIWFGPQSSSSFNFGAGWPGGNRLDTPRFDLVEHAKAVYEQVRDAQRKSFN